MTPCPSGPVTLTRIVGGAFEPEPAERQDRGHLRRADPCGDRAHRAEHVRVGVGADGEVPRDHPAVLGEDLVADAVVADVVEVGQVLLRRELPEDPVEDGGAFGGRRDPVVDGDDDPFRVPDPLRAHVAGTGRRSGRPARASWRGRPARRRSGRGRPGLEPEARARIFSARVWLPLFVDHDLLRGDH